MFYKLKTFITVGMVALLVILSAITLFGCGEKSNSVAFDGSTTFTDSRDGKTYRIVQMPNGKIWMAENLNYATNGESWCYGNNESNCNTYGRLYTWNAAVEACPDGWSLPSHLEWSALTRAVGGDSTAGRKLKSRTGWGRNGNGTNEFGFSALPGGERWSNGSFYNVGSVGYWWSATEYDNTNARYRSIGNFIENNHGANVYSSVYVKVDAFSVRCVRD